MSLIVVCPGCQGQFAAPQAMAGKIARCPSCSHKIIVPAAPPNTAASRPGAAPARKSMATSAQLSPRSNSEHPDKKTTSSSDAPNTIASEKSSWFKLPQVSRGMRWFLVIVVAPIAGIYLLGEIAPPLIRLFRGSPAPASSGSFGASPEERDALLQQLEEHEAQAQQQSASRVSLAPAAQDSQQIRVPLLNDDRFGTTIDEFRAKHDDILTHTPASSLKSRNAEFGLIETIQLRPTTENATARYIFLNAKFGALEAFIPGHRHQDFVAALTAQMASVPVEIAVPTSPAAAKSGKDFMLPQLRWENPAVIVTVTPMSRSLHTYKYKVWHKIHAKTYIDYVAALGFALQ